MCCSWYYRDATTERCNNYAPCPMLNTKNYDCPVIEKARAFEQSIALPENRIRARRLVEDTVKDVTRL